MKLYEPYAVVQDGGREREQWTYGSCPTMEKALKCINTWNEMFWVKSAYIKETDPDNSMYEKIYIVSFGKVEERR